MLLFAAASAWGQTASQTAAPAAVANARKPRPPKPDQPAFNPNVVFLDAAHGGPDEGAKLGEDSSEKDATLAFAGRLKALLTARGFAVITTRDEAGGQDANPQPDQRVEQANRSRAVACILIHASNGGHGVHLYTSSLTAPYIDPDPDQPRPIVPWDTAQAASLALSLKLSADLAAAIVAIRVPLVAGRASVRPIDSMTCPALALELAPLAGDEPTSPADSAYQDRIARAVADGLATWRGQVVAQIMPPATAPTAEPPKPAPKPKPPAPRPKAIPEEVPIVVTPGEPAPPQKPAPIIRKAPEAPPIATPPAAPKPGALP